MHETRERPNGIRCGRSREERLGAIQHLRARDELAQLVAKPEPVRAQPPSLNITAHALQPGVLGVKAGVEQRARGREADQIAWQGDWREQRLGAHFVRASVNALHVSEIIREAMRLGQSRS